MQKSGDGVFLDLTVNATWFVEETLMAPTMP